MLLKEIKILKENDKIEFKKAKGGLPSSLWESYSGFANTDGGVIVLGIDEIEKNKFVASNLSLEEIEKLQDSFWDTINNTQKVSANILVNKDVYVDKFDDSLVLVINIRRANRFEKPVYINNNVYSGTYRRNHQGDYHATKPEIDLMIKDSSNVTTDKTCLEEFSLKDLNIDSINRYKQMLKVSRPTHILLTMSDLDFYTTLGIAKIGTDNKTHPTRAGLLMFGKEHRITDEFSHYFLDYQDHREETPDIRWVDRVYSTSGDWSGNVFDFFFRIYNKLVQDLYIPFELRNEKRIDDTKLHKSIREALCNTLVHADYYGTRGIVIKKFKNRIEFSNPGCMRLSLEEAFEGGNSDPRNDTMLKIFSLISIGERSGFGISSIVEASSLAGFPKPKIEENFKPDRTKLTLYLGELDLSRIVAGGYGNNRKVELFGDEEKTFNFISKRESTSRLDLEKYLGYGKTKCSLILKSLLQKEVIFKIGEGKSTRYYKN